MALEHTCYNTLSTLDPFVVASFSIPNIESTQTVEYIAAIPAILFEWMTLLAFVACE